MKRELLLFTIFLIFQAQSNDEHLRLISQKNLLNFHQDALKSSSIDDVSCDSKLHLFQEALDNNEPWAIRFVDTWAKIHAGYLSGNNINIGDFDTCVGFQHNTESIGIFRGQYCLVTITASPNSTLSGDRTDLSLKNLANFFRKNQIVTTNGFCMPIQCSNKKAVEFLNQNFLFKNDLIALGAACRDIHDVQLDVVGYMAISIFTIIALLLIISTIYEIIIRRSKNPEPNKLLISFSVYTNGMKLFDMTKIKSPSSLNCLHGLRALSIFWIILGHRIFNQTLWGNPSDVAIFFSENTILATIIMTYHLAVDTFFVMGALLMTMSTLRDCEKKQLNIFRMIWRRYFRYTPVYAALILSFVAFYEFIIQGPLYTEALRDSCVKNWWYALLYIQNYLDLSEMCLSHGWYLSADFQLFIISPFIIFLIYKYGRKLLVLPAFLCFATIIYIIVITVVYNIEMSTITPDYLRLLYYPTHSRAGPWFIGMILGYFLYMNRGKTFKVSKLFNAFMWILTISTLCTIVFLQFAFSIANNPVSQASNTSYIALQRNLWALSLCWIVFACQHLKTGGIVRWFLSWPHWQPISRMGLSMYLIGAVYQVFMIFNQRTALYLNFWHVIPILMSDIVIIIIISTISYLTFEAPPLIIEDYVYYKIKNKA